MEAALSRLTRSAGQGQHVARLLDGPLAGSLVLLPARGDGNPPDELPVESEPHGAYLLAGLAGRRGILPYRWLTKEESAELRRWLRGRGTRLKRPKPVRGVGL